jgi:hypothetical protein
MAAVEAERALRLVVGKHLVVYGSKRLGEGPRRPAAVLPCAASHDAEVPAVPEEQREAYELLLIEEADAWFEYLEATRGQSEARYKEVEPWAWARLRQRLRAVRARRAKLRPAAA